MRYMLLACLVSLVIGCGGETPIPALQPAIAPDGVELPTIDLLGAIPPAEGRVTIAVDAEGALTIDGKACAWDGLADRLKAVSTGPDVPKLPRKKLQASMTSELLKEDLEEVEEDTEEILEQEIVVEEPVIRDAEIEDEVFDHEESGNELPPLPFEGPGGDPGPRESGTFAPDGSRNADVLLCIDRCVPWIVVAHVLQTCAHPDLKLYRIFYLAQGADGRGEGSLAVFLVTHHCGADSTVEARRVKLHSKPGDDGLDAAGIAQAMRARLPSKDIALVVEVKANEYTPYGHIVDALYSAVRARAASIGLEGVAVEERAGGPPDWCRAAREAGPFRWTVSGQASRPGVVGELAPPGRADGYAGNANDFPFVRMWEEIEEEDDR